MSRPKHPSSNDTPAVPSHDLHTHALVQRVEEASINAWPALTQILLDGWIVRLSRGFTKRSNCIVPLYSIDEDALSPNREHMLDKIRHCENIYAREQLQTVFRLYSAPANSSTATLDELLEARGYNYVEPCSVLSAPLTGIQLSSPNVAFVPLDQWLSAYSRLTDMPELAQGLHNVILRSISGECGFAVLHEQGEAIACGLVVVERELAGLFDIYTAADRRNQGLGRQIVQATTNWAQEHGAQHAYLQVIADNEAAIALYEKLEFHELYRYWYRIAG